MGDLSIQKPYRTDSNNLDNERQGYLESLWCDNNLTSVLKFYKELRYFSEMIKFSVGRNPAEIKIIRRGNSKSNIKFIIPTMDHNSQQCKMLEKNYKNYEVLFLSLLVNCSIIQNLLTLEFHKSSGMKNLKL